MIATAGRDETVHEQCLAEDPAKRAADISAQVGDEAYTIEIMRVGEPRPQSK